VLTETIGVFIWPAAVQTAGLSHNRLASRAFQVSRTEHAAMAQQRLAADLRDDQARPRGVGAKIRQAFRSALPLAKMLRDF
jgi:hypothetical protein